MVTCTRHGREATDEMAHVLVVDDDPVVRRLVGVTLSDEGYDVAVASDGEEALRMISETSPDAIVLDLEMPRLDGRAAFRELRQRGVRAPVIILSANGAHAAKQELAAEAAMDKPFDPFELLRRLQRLLRAWPDDGAAAAGN
ncbi:MAG: response regulator [Dehalococcoidia bacterium]|nr:response regulator [Dehalococcoidia bacterium]